MRKKCVKLLLTICCITIIITQTACGLNAPVKESGFYLDTICTLEIHDMKKSEAEKVIENTFKEIQKYEKLFSRTMKNTDIYNINHANGEPVEVSDDTIYLLTQAIKVCEESNGKFDITVGKITSLWDFTSDSPKVPNDSDIQAALPTVSYKNIIIEGNTVRLSNPNTWLELGAIAKGYIADKASKYMKDQGVENAVINLGGNIVTLGENENKDGWYIGIETPYSHGNDIIGRLTMKDQTLVTSGIFERHFVENGVDYHHVLNPKTGYPVDTDILCISILGDEGTSVLCDAYSTTCLILGKEKAIEFMSDKEDFEYCIVDKNNEITQSEHFNLEEVE